MTLWVVRAGRYGEREQVALEQGLAVIGWQELGNLAPVAHDRKALAGLLFQVYHDKKQATVRNWESQLWPFIATDPQADRIKIGDTICLPMKSKATIAVGKVTGDYKYDPSLPADARHTRAVKWIAQIPRASLDQDLRFSFGGAMTIFRITKPGAEAVVSKLASGVKPAESGVDLGLADGSAVATDAGLPVDIAETARDDIRGYITKRFKGHGLTRLVAAVLETQGYTVSIAPEGADRGVDIIAGRGPLGFEAPRLVVQVKSGDSAVDSATVQQLRGAMAMTQAQHGLFVAWAGYKGSLNWGATLPQHFDLRLWTDSDLIAAIENCYENLPADIQAELPLQRIWALVSTEDD